MSVIYYNVSKYSLFEVGPANFQALFCHVKVAEQTQSSYLHTVQFYQLSSVQSDVIVSISSQVVPT